MNIAAIIALLLSSGVCAKTDFHGQGGTTLRVIVCPLMAPAEPPAQAAPPAEKPRPAAPTGTDI